MQNLQLKHVTFSNAEEISLHCFKCRPKNRKLTVLVGTFLPCYKPFFFHNVIVAPLAMFHLALSFKGPT